MAEQTEGSTQIEASPEDVMEVLTDFDAYPTWAGIKKVEVRKKDSKGRGSEVYMEVAQMGVEAKYTLAYRYKAKDGGMSWTPRRRLARSRTSRASTSSRATATRRR